MNVIQRVREHKEAARLFKAFLLTKRTPEQVSKFVVAKDSLVYGEIMEFINSYGASIIITSETVYIVVDKKHASQFATIEHGNMLFMYYREHARNQGFQISFNNGIVEFFKLLNESIL